MKNRYFFAIEIPSALQAGLRALCHGLPKTRWVAEDSFHITLAFLGELNAQRKEAALELFAQDSVIAPSFELSLRSVHCFRNPRTKTVLWAGVEPDARLLGLQAEVASRLRKEGFHLEKRSFRPHVTLGRASQALSQERLHEWLHLHAEFRTPAFRSGSFCLYESTLHPEGARYEILGRYPFSDGSEP